MRVGEFFLYCIAYEINNNNNYNNLVEVLPERVEKQMV